MFDACAINLRAFMQAAQNLYSNKIKIFIFDDSFCEKFSLY